MNLLRTSAVTLLTVAVLADCHSGGASTDHVADSAASSSGAPTSSSAPTPSPTPTPAPAPPPTPSRGDCYSLSYDQAVAPTSDKGAVGCVKAHTSQTYATGTVDDLVHGHLYAADSDRVQQQVAQACPAELADFLGTTDDQLRLSLLRPVWFTPTVAESDAGAAWYRCDVIAVAGTDKLAKVTGGLKGVLGTDAGRAAYGMCGTDEPGTADFSRVLCRDDHSWKAISVLDLTDLPAQHAPKKKTTKGGYPGLDAVKAAGADPCAAAARAIAPDALHYQWGYEWPTKTQWDAGQTYGRCWAPDAT